MAYTALTKTQLELLQAVPLSSEQLEASNEKAKGVLNERQGKLTTSISGPIKDGQTKKFNLLLLGKTGSGKSATGNLIVGREAFLESMQSISETKTIAVAHSIMDSASVVVIDTPGFNDTHASQEDTITEMAKIVDIFKEGIHGILFAFNLGNPRFTAEEQEAFEQIKQGVLGDGFINNCFVILTHGEDLAKKKSLEQYLEAERTEDSILDQLLNKTIERRVIAVDNSDTTEYGQQVQREQIVRLVASHSKVPCQPAIFKKFLEDQKKVTGKVPEVYRPHVGEMERVLSEQYVGMPHQQIMSMSPRGMSEIMEMMVTAVTSMMREQSMMNAQMISGLVKQQEATNAKVDTQLQKQKATISSQKRELDAQRAMMSQQSTMNAQSMEELRGIAKSLQDSYRDRLTSEQHRPKVKDFSVPLLSPILSGIKKAWNWVWD